MNKMKLTAFFAVMSMAVGVAVAQPDATSGTEMMHHDGAARGARGQGGAPPAGPFAKLQAAKNLPSITPEQKQKLDAFMEEHKADADSMRDEMRSTMQKARDTTDPAARKALMKPLRDKFEASQTAVNAIISSTLTPEQQTEVNQKASEMMKQAGRERMRGGEDHMTSGPRAGGPKPGAPADNAGKKGKKGKKAGKDGKRFDREKEAPPASDNASTTGTAAANPFANK